MAKSVTAVKNILKTEEGVLEKLQAAIKFIAHKETKVILREVVKNKKIEIRCYKQILKAAEKCPAVKKTATAKRGSCKTTTKRGACKSRSTAAKKTVKKTAKKTEVKETEEKPKKATKKTEEEA